MEEIIRFIILNNLEEVGKIDSLDGLCFYFANNIKADLELMEVPVSIYNINEGEGYNHYYLIADYEYLIDVTYGQFMERENEVPIMFADFPGNILGSSSRGKVILEDLLNFGYHKLEDGDLDIYLASFKLKEKRIWR